MPLHRPLVPSPPEPTKIFFDPYHSSSTGHQRAGSRLAGSTSWRDSRLHKLPHQLKDTSGGGGKQHLSDLVGAGSKDFRKDGRKDNGDWEPGAPGLREKGWQDIRGMMAGTRKTSSKGVGDDDIEAERKRLKRNTPDRLSNPDEDRRDEQLPKHTYEDVELTEEEEKLPQIFRGLNIYLNGSTAPLISDHKLKQVFAQHGGGASIMLGRRTVTHVIIGENCGGGLASTKIEKEINTVGGKGIKFVTAKWILDSVEKGIRQPEARYAPHNLETRIGGSGQGSVRNMFMKK